MEPFLTNLPDFLINLIVEIDEGKEWNEAFDQTLVPPNIKLCVPDIMQQFARVDCKGVLFILDKFWDVVPE